MPATIRTITVGVGDRHPLGPDVLARAANVLADGARRASEAGHEVQTTRVALRPLFADLAAESDAAIATYVADLRRACDEQGIGFCSLGPYPADDPAVPLDRLAALPDLLLAHPPMSATVHLASERHGMRQAAALHAARAMAALGATDGGAANFRFAALAHCTAGGPFFPQAFAEGPEWSVSVGLQSAGVVRDALARVAEKSADAAERLPAVAPAVRDALTEAARPVVRLVERLAADHGCRLAGIDLSPAPLGEESIADAFEAVGVGTFGGPGTLALAAAITAGIKAAPLPLCGYSGLMLPVLEDRTLGERAAAGALTVHSLLAYSAVCGTGLDTVPLPGDTPPERIAALLLDVATLADRLRKPLAARLFLVPGGRAGDATTFTSPYLTNSRVMAL